MRRPAGTRPDRHGEAGSSRRLNPAHGSTGAAGAARPGRSPVALRRARVGDALTLDPGEGRQGVIPVPTPAQEVADHDAPDPERVRDQAAMAPPGDRLGAHDGGLTVAGEVDQTTQARLPL